MALTIGSGGRRTCPERNPAAGVELGVAVGGMFEVRPISSLTVSILPDHNPACRIGNTPWRLTMVAALLSGYFFILVQPIGCWMRGTVVSTDCGSGGHEAVCRVWIVCGMK